MKLREVYIPVFEGVSDNDGAAIRQLRSDFGSRKTELECAHCAHVFGKRIGPNTNEVCCPACNHNRVRLAATESAKAKAIKMREALEDQDLKTAADCSISILADLVGKYNSTNAVSQIQEALAGLAAVEPALSTRIRDIAKLVKEGNGREEILEIASKMGLENYFKG